MRTLLTIGLLAASVLTASAHETGQLPQFGGLPLSGTLGGASPTASGAVVFQSGPSAPTRAPYDMVLMQGDSLTDGLRLEISRKELSGAWSPWRAAALYRRPNGRFWARAEFSSASNASLRLRVIRVSPKAASSFNLYALEVLLSGMKSELRPESNVPMRPVIRSSAPVFISRAQWGAKPPKEDPVSHTPLKITQHHSAGRQTHSLAESLEEVRFIQDFHQNGRGWSDIGYHFLIDKDGRIFEGRPLNVQGAHVRGANAGNIGIVLLGFHHKPYDHSVSAQQIQSIRAIGRWLVSNYEISPSEYFGHRDQGQTSCPGDVLYALLGKIQNGFSRSAWATSMDILMRRVFLSGPAAASLE